jgi:hypothetical protein
MISKLITLIALAILAASAHAEVEDSGVMLRIKTDVPQLSFHWPAKAQSNVALTKEQVKSLLNAILGQNPDFAGQTVNVDQFRLATLDGGAPFLLATTDSSPMKAFQQITVLRCGDQICRGVILQSEPPIDLNRQLVSVRLGDAKKILIGRCVCPGGEREPGRLKHLFGVTEDVVGDQSAEYPQFFRD